MPDPTAGGGLAADITAIGGAIAAIVGAIVLWPTRKRRENRAAAAYEDPESTAPRLRERLTALETWKTSAQADLDNLNEHMALLRAQEITAEAHARPRPPRRRDGSS